MMEEPKYLRYRLVSGITVGISRDPDARKPLRFFVGPRDGHEDLNQEQIDELLTMCLYVRRWGRKKKVKYPWTTKVPDSTRFGKDIINLFGRLDRFYKSGRDSVE